MHSLNRPVNAPAEARLAGSRGTPAERLKAVQAYLEANLHREELSPAATAMALGISVRQLHLLFVPTGTTFSRYLLMRRLERTRVLIADPAGQRIIDIAYSCGIKSSTVFYRGFRRAFGITPTEYRAGRRQAE